ncbi:hypothetical protein D3C71_1972400 [compost metagenome]
MCNRNCLAEIGREAMFGNDLIGAPNSEAFAEPGGDHRRHLACGCHPAEPPRPSFQNGRFAFRLLHDDMDIRKPGGQRIDHDIGVQPPRRHHQ